MGSIPGFETVSSARVNILPVLDFDPEMGILELPSTPAPEDNRTLPGFIGMRRAFRAAMQHPRERWSAAETLEFHQQWMELVEPYSARRLTQPTDRLVAIVGVARVLQRRTQAGFLAGLWRQTLDWNLLWKCERPDVGAPAVPRRCDVPSWSWAAVDGAVTHPFTPDRASATETDGVRRTMGGIRFLVKAQNWTVHVCREIGGMVRYASLRGEGQWGLVPYSAAHVVEFCRDVEPEDNSRDQEAQARWFLMPIVQVGTPDPQHDHDVHGIVVWNTHDRTYERVGYFASTRQRMSEALAVQVPSICLGRCVCNGGEGGTKSSAV